MVLATATPLPPVAQAPAGPTATPIFIPLAALTSTPPPASTPPFPTILVGKILFLADIGGGSGVQAYVMDPDGSNVGRLTSRQFYDRTYAREGYSADRRYRAFVEREVGGSQERQIFVYDAFYNSEKQQTHFGDGSTTWDPAWSPTDEVLVFVSNETDNDEIWLARKDQWPATQLTTNDPAWDKHPSWSPDGSQIVFMSNRTGRQQLWIMNADGSNQRQLTDFAFETWDPVWVKFTDQ